MSAFPDVIDFESDAISLEVGSDPDLIVEFIEPNGTIVAAAVDDVDPVSLILSEPTVTIEETDDITMFVIPGLFGQPGGGDSSVDIAEIAASEAIPALALVTGGGEIADSSNNLHFNHVVGITMNAVVNGFIATCVVEGEVTDLSWNWAPNVKLFLNGTTLSTIPVSTGFSQLVGITRNNHTVFIRLQIPIKL